MVTAKKKNRERLNTVSETLVVLAILLLAANSVLLTLKIKEYNSLHATLTAREKIYKTEVDRSNELKRNFAVSAYDNKYIEHLIHRYLSYYYNNENFLRY